MSDTPSYHSLEITNIETVESVNRTYAFNRNGSISRIIKVEGINDTGFALEDYNKVHQSIIQFMRSLSSTDIDVQFFKLRRRVDNVLELENPSAPVYMKERNRFLREELIKKGEILKDYFYISIVSHPAQEDEGFVESIKSNLKFLKDVFKGGSNIDELNDRFSPGATLERMRRLDAAVSSLSTSLDTAKCGHVVLNTKKEICECYMKFLRDTSRGNDTTALENAKEFRRTLLLGTSTEEYPKYFVHDDNFHKTYRLDYVSAEENIHARSVKPILDAPFEFNYMVAFRNTTHDEAKAKLDRKIKIASMVNNAENNPNSVTENYETQANLDESRSARMSYTQKGSLALETAIHFTYRQPMLQIESILKSEQMTLDAYVQELDQKLHTAYFGSVQQSYWATVMGPWENYCRTMPGMINLKSLAIKTSIEFPIDITHILPLYNHSRPDLKYYGVNHFFTDSRTILPVNLMDPDLPSWVYLITGDMGSGKSVTCNLFISMLETCILESGKAPITRIIDWGGVAGSFYKRSKVRDVYGKMGTVLNFASPKKPSIQVLELTEIGRAPTPAKIQALKLACTSVGLEEQDIVENIGYYYEATYGFEGKLTREIRESFLVKHLGVDKKTALGLSPLFELQPGECEPSVDQMNYIMSFLEILLSPDVNKTIIDYNRDLMMDYVRETYRRVTNRFPMLYDLLTLLRESNPDKGDDVNVIIRLKNFTREGTYKMFDRNGDVPLDADFILFDMYGLDRDPKLKRLYGIAISALVQDDMYKKMDRVRICLVDECSFSLENDSFRKFMVSFCRTSRKYKFLLALSTQLYYDFFEHNENDGKIITDLATNRIFCGYNSMNAINDAVRRCNMSKGEAHEMTNLGVKKGEKGSIVSSYSRFLLISNKKTGREVLTVKNILSPFEYQLYSSSKEDNAILRFYTEEKGMNIVEAIEIVNSKKFAENDGQGLLNHLALGNHLDALAIVREHV